MKIIRKIALTELQALFYSPIAWLILIVFTFQASMTFTDLYGGYVRNQEMNRSVGNLTFYIFGGVAGLFTVVQGYLYLYVPLLTMGLMSRELSSGSIKLLYSSPVKNSQIILGKYLSMMVYGLVLIAILFVYALWACVIIESVDFPLILSGLLGLYLLICAYAAIGLLMSSLTSYQVVAAICTLAVLTVLNFVSRFGQSIDFVREITYWLSISGRASEFINGLICSEDVLYFIIVSVLFLTLSILRLKAIRQKTRWQESITKYISVFLLAMLLGYITSRPAFMGFYDATHTKQRTLTESSQKIIKQLKGGLKMTVYVNALDGNIWSGLPSSRKWDIERFSQYIRFKPEMDIKYVYYYTNPGGGALERRYPGLTDSQMVGKISKAADVDSMMFMPPEEINKIIDLSSEGYRFVRLLERDNGQKTFLRMFDDAIGYPSETEISAALKRLVMDLPRVGFLSGHGERDYNNDGDRGYYRFSQDKPFRYALINQGFDFEEVTLSANIPSNINILVIADMRHSLTVEEQARLDAYVARGGNLLIIGEPRRQEVMNPLVAPFGVQFMPGQLVKRVGAVKETKEESGAVYIPEGTTYFPEQQRASGDNFQADLIISNVTKEGGELSYIFERIRNREQVITMPGCVGLAYEENPEFQITPLLVSDTLDSWNELETTNFIDDTVRINPAIGEEARSYPTGLALSRLVKGKEQKIVILGDADCLSNAEMSRRRTRIMAANYNMIMAAFFWMSDNEVPIDVRRPIPPDNKLHTTGDGVKVGKWILTGIFPLLLIAGCLFIWLRRRGR